MNHLQLRRDLEELLHRYELPNSYAVPAHQLSETMMRALDEYIKAHVVKDWSLPIPKQTN